MTKTMPVFLRVHTEVLKGQQGRAGTTQRKSRDPKWPECALVLDCFIPGLYRVCFGILGFLTLLVRILTLLH